MALLVACLRRERQQAGLVLLKGDLNKLFTNVHDADSVLRQYLLVSWASVQASSSCLPSFLATFALARTETEAETEPNSGRKRKNE